MIALKINAAVSPARAREQGMTAKSAALGELGLDLAAMRRYEIELRAGVVRAYGWGGDHERAMQGLRPIGELPAHAPRSTSESGWESNAFACPKKRTRRRA